MSTAVVQLFVTEAAAHSAWTKKSSGVACFIRDSTKKSYFIRVYCLSSLTMLWEEELYDDISISKPRDFLITFEGQVCVIFEINDYRVVDVFFFISRLYVALFIQL